MLFNVFTRSAMAKIADIKLVIYGALRFDGTFRVQQSICETQEMFLHASIPS